MATETVINRPAPFVETLGTDLAKQVTAQQGVPIVTTGIAGLTQQPGETAAGFKARQDAARAFTTRQQNLAGIAPTVAGQDALQRQAQTLAQQGVGSFQPFLQRAQTELGVASGLGTAALGQLAGIQTGAPTAAQTQAFMSPYQQQVIDTTLAEFDRQAAAGIPQLQAQALQAGAFGGGREGVQLAEYQSQSDRNRAALQAQLLQQGFQDAAARRQQDLANQINLAGQQLQAGQFQTGLAQLVPSLQSRDIRTLGSVGAVQQAQSQAQLDAQREANRLAAFEPYERIGTFGSGVASLISGYPGQRQFTTVPNPTPLQTSLGIGATLAGIYGSLRR